MNTTTLAALAAGALLGAAVVTAVPSNAAITEGPCTAVIHYRTGLEQTTTTCTPGDRTGVTGGGVVYRSKWRTIG